MHELSLLCLPGLGVTVDSPDFTVTLTAPDGTIYTETYAYQDVDGRVNVSGAKGGRGSIFEPNGPDPTQSVGVFLHTAANVPAGQWMVSAASADGSVTVGPATVTLEQTNRVFSVEEQAVTNPLLSPERIFGAGETLYVFGAAYAPDTAYLVVFYLEDPALGNDERGRPQLSARYATSVVTDGAGGFGTEFVVGTASPTGEYFPFVETAFLDSVGVSFFFTPFEIK